MNQSIVSLKTLHIFFYIVLGVAFLCAPAFAAAPYTVEGVKVDVTAKNAIEARDQAFAKAQGDAFGLLAKNLLPPERFASFTPPGPSVLAGMIQDYEITQEKLSSTRYSGTYTIRFRAAAVQRYLGVAGEEPLASASGSYGSSGQRSVPVNQAGASLLVLPFYQDRGNMLLWSADNVWMNAWSNSMQGGSSLISVPVGDITDVKDISDNQALTYDRARLRDMVARYGAQEAVMVVALPNNPEAGAMAVSIYRTDRGGPELVRKIFISHNGSEAALMNDAVSRTREALRGDWKEKRDASSSYETTMQTQSQSSYSPSASSTDVTPMHNGPSNNYLGSVRFANLQEWAGLQRNLSRIPGVARVVIQSLSPREAVLEISYAGDVNTLRRELDTYNVTLVGYEARPSYQSRPEPGVRPVPEPRQPTVREPAGYTNNF